MCAHMTNVINTLQRRYLILHQTSVSLLSVVPLSLIITKQRSKNSIGTKLLETRVRTNPGA